MARYKKILDRSEHTSSAYWGACVAEDDKVIELWHEGRSCLSIDQPWHVLDTKTGRVITRPELAEIASRQSSSRNSIKAGR